MEGTEGSGRRRFRGGKWRFMEVFMRSYKGSGIYGASEKLREKGRLETAEGRGGTFVNG